MTRHSKWSWADVKGGDRPESPIDKRLKVLDDMIARLDAIMSNLPAKAPRKVKLAPRVTADAPDKPAKEKSKAPDVSHLLTGNPRLIERARVLKEIMSRPGRRKSAPITAEEAQELNRRAPL